MRFELFEGSASRGSIELEDEGVIRFDIEEPTLRLLIMLFFASDLSAMLLEGGDGQGERVVRPDWTSWGFERACRQLERLGPLRAVSRSAKITSIRRDQHEAPETS